MRTERDRDAEWAERDRSPRGVERYDLRADPAASVNLADRPENKALAIELSKQLRAGWRGTAQ